MLFEILREQSNKRHRPVEQSNKRHKSVVKKHAYGDNNNNVKITNIDKIMITVCNNHNINNDNNDN